MLDMWTDVFASPGWRTTGTQAQTLVIVPPGRKPDLREKLIDQFILPKDTQRIDAPTPYVWIIGRIKTDGPSDYDAVHKLQAALKITPLSQWGKTPEPAAFKPDPKVDMKTPPKLQVDRLPADEFFAYAAELLKLHPPHLTDQPIIAQLTKLGIEPGKSFDMSKVDPVIQRGLDDARHDAQMLMAWKVRSIARVVNGWSMNTDTMGVYGNYYLKRAIVAQIGLGANLPEDAIYPINLFDGAHQTLDGANKYTIHFDKGAMPPADAFWSITLYDNDGFQVENKLNRFAVSSWMPFEYNGDGSLDLYFQKESPGAGREANLATRAEGVVQPHHASLCAQNRGSDWQVESARGCQGIAAAVICERSADLIQIASGVYWRFLKSIYKNDHPPPFGKGGVIRSSLGFLGHFPPQRGEM